MLVGEKVQVCGLNSDTPPQSTHLHKKKRGDRGGREKGGDRKRKKKGLSWESHASKTEERKERARVKGLGQKVRYHLLRRAVG